MVATFGTSASGFIGYLASSLSQAGNEDTIYLSAITTLTGETITTADFASFGLGELTIDPLSSTNIEFTTFTGVDAGNLSLTGVVRGLSAVGDESADSRQPYHPVGTIVIISFGVQSIQSLVNLAGTQTITGLKLFSTSPVAPNPTSNSQVSTKAYTDNIRNKRISATTSIATLSPNSELFDMYELTAQAEGLTVANNIGIPTDGQALIIRITDDGTPQTITWDTEYREINQALPTTTIAGKILYLGFFANGTDGTMDLLGVSQQS